MKQLFLLFILMTWVSQIQAQETFKRFNPFEGNFPSMMVNHTTIDSDNNEKWISTIGEGLVHWKSDDSLEVFNTSNSLLPNDSVFSTLIDGNENLWIATFGDGLVKIDVNNNWTIYDYDNSDLPSDFVTRIKQDDEGNIWIATIEFMFDFTEGIKSGGLVKITPNNQWTVYNTSNSGLTSNNIFSLEIDNNNHLWLGCISADGPTEINAGGGLLHFNPTENTWIVYDVDNSDIPSNNVMSIELDEQGNVYVGTLFGYLGKMDNQGNWKSIFTEFNDIFSGSAPFHFLDIKLINDQIITCTGPPEILCLPSINLDLAAAGVSTFKETAEGFEQTNENDIGVFSNRIVNHIVEEGETLWLSTYLDGLVAYNENGINNVPAPKYTFTGELPSLPISPGILSIRNIGTLYPNPASDYLIFESTDWELINEAEAVLIWDINGKILLQEDIKNNTSNIRIDLPNGLPKTFFVGVKIGEELYVEKLIKD